MDESQNDDQPNFAPKPTPKPAYGKPVGKGYVVYQTNLPVLPINYVNQQNQQNIYSEGQNYNDNGNNNFNGKTSARSPRQPTHRIIFPNSLQQNLNSYARPSPQSPTGYGPPGQTEQQQQLPLDQLSPPAPQAPSGYSNAGLPPPPPSQDYSQIQVPLRPPVQQSPYDGGQSQSGYGSGPTGVPPQSATPYSNFVTNNNNNGLNLGIDPRNNNYENNVQQQKSVDSQLTPSSRSFFPPSSTSSSSSGNNYQQSSDYGATTGGSINQEPHHQQQQQQSFNGPNNNNHYPPVAATNAYSSANNNNYQQITPTSNLQTQNSNPSLAYNNQRRSNNNQLNTPNGQVSSWRPVYPQTSSHATKSQSPSSASDSNSFNAMMVPQNNFNSYQSGFGDETDDGFVSQEKMRFKRQIGEGGTEDPNTNSAEEVESVCRTQKRFISPRAALNDKAQWKYIVNLGDRDPRLRQIIKVDVCS